MKILWVVNKPCGALHEKLYGKKSVSGLWLDAALEEAKAYNEDEIVVVNISKKVVLPYYKTENISFYTIAGEPNQKYNYKSKKAIAKWKGIIDKETPDIIEIWGTEFPYALAAMKAAPKIPTVVYIQGILDSIAKYYLAGLNLKELKYAVSYRDFIKGESLKKTQQQFFNRSMYEKEILGYSGHFIIENKWAEAYCKKINPELKPHFCELNIASVFSDYNWEINETEPFSIMCPAANYSIKGLHMLLNALKIVKDKYSQVKLYIPGIPLRDISTFKERLKQTGYEKLIRNRIKELDIKENVIYMGNLISDQMAEKMSKVNCFAMTSAIENHSSTLKEAMTVGVPCVASYVGGVPEYATDGENCLLYRFEDYEVLAQNIIRLFEDKALCEKLSNNARSKMRTPKEKTDYARMREIFEEIIKE